MFCSQRLSFRKRPDRFYRIPSFLWNGHRSKRPGSEAGHSLPFCADNKNEWHYTTTSSIHSRRAKRRVFNSKCFRFRDSGPKRHELTRSVTLYVYFGTCGFLLLGYVFLSLSMYSYCCLCIHTVVYVFLDAATLTEVFPCFFLSCKANARV